MRKTKVSIQQEGRSAFIAGIFRHKNPYSFMSWQFQAWLDGWVKVHDSGESFDEDVYNG